MPTEESTQIEEPIEPYVARRSCRVPIDVNSLHNQQLNINDRLAVVITTAIGSMYAVYLLSAFTVFWMLTQHFMSRQAFDPYPYAFLLFLGNILQLLLMPLIMVGQNIQSKHAELRAQEAYETTVAAYHDTEEIMSQLEAQGQELARQSALLLQMAKNFDESQSVKTAVTAENSGT